MLEIGSLVDGKYKILSKIGQGGMSVVYLAMNEAANKPWAVKEVRKDGEGVKDFEVVKQGLVAETDILKKLRHPNLPSIIDVIDMDDTFIIIMDYIEGNSLNKALAEQGAQPQSNVIAWAKQLCDVLGYLHTRKPPIIYRDMKPANIMLKPDGTVTLIDFGTAREFKEKNLEDTTCLGTVGYAAPEQFGGMGQTDGRTDIYCLGATLYHLLTGMNPCEPPYEILPIRQINPGLSPGLEKIIMKCTQRDPNDRYQTVAELEYALEHYDEVDNNHRKKQKKKLGLFLGACALTLVFAAGSVWGYTRAEKQKTADYDNIMANAQSAEDCCEAILVEPSRIEAYIGSEEKDIKGLIDYLTEDDSLSSEEAAILAKLRVGLDKVNSQNSYSTTVDVMEELHTKNPDGYQDVSYRIGETYLFYYDIGVEEDKYATAAAWFRNAEGKYPDAAVYCDISECMQNIRKYAKSEQYARLYEEYGTLWGQVLELQEKAEDFDDDIRLRVWNEIVQMICNNAVEFCEVTNKDDILAVLDTIDERSAAVTNTFLQDNIVNLQDNIELSRTKINSVLVDEGDSQNEESGQADTTAEEESES